MQFPISRLTKLLFQPSFSKSRRSSTNCFCFPTQPSCHLWQRRFALKGCAWTIRERVEIKGTKNLVEKRDINQFTYHLFSYRQPHITHLSHYPTPFRQNFIIFSPFLFFENLAFREPPNSPNCSIFVPNIHHVFHHSCFFYAFRPFCYHLRSRCRISKTRLSTNEASMGCQRIRRVQYNCLPAKIQPYGCGWWVDRCGKA